MRKLFAEILLEEMSKNPDIVLITADMGYGLWDKIRETFPDRFYNVGASEQLMIGMATGFALEGKIPVCYSITPFLLYRPFEFIRNYMSVEKTPLKLFGGGRDRDYGYLGYTHWAEEDEKIIGALPNVKVYKPIRTMADEYLRLLMVEAVNSTEPTYFNLVK
jgi:transketolase